MFPVFESPLSIARTSLLSDSDSTEGILNSSFQENDNIAI